MYKILWLWLLNILIIQVVSADNSQVKETPNYFQNQQFNSITVKYLNDKAPYQYTGQNYAQLVESNRVVKGYDIDLLKLYLNSTNINYNFEINNINMQSNSIVVGLNNNDINTATLNLSAIYRYDDYAFFMLRNSYNFEYNNINNFFLKLKIQGVKIGILSNINYNNPALTNFLTDPLNQLNIIYYASSADLIKALRQGTINGFIGEHYNINSFLAQPRYQNMIEEIPLNIKVPVYFGFSKDVAEDVVNKINNNIIKLKDSDALKNLNNKYLQPIKLLKLMDQQWFDIILLIATLCFATSAVIVASQYNANFLGTLILTLLPAIGGGIIRDLLIGITPVTIITKYMVIINIIAIAAVGFAVLKMIQLKESANQWVYNKLLNKIILVCDFTGQAIFTTFGVLVAARYNITPLIIWGPLLAFITSQGGGILRDMMLKDRISFTLTNNIQAELSIVWGIILAILLMNTDDNTTLQYMNYTVILTIIGSLISGYLICNCKLKNVKFNDTSTIN